MKNTEYKLRYLVIPDFILEDENLNYTDAKIYSFIHAYKADKFYFTNEKLGLLFKLHHDTVSVSIVKLIDLHYLEAKYEMKAGGGRIRFLKDTFSKTVSTQRSTRSPHSGNINKININKIENSQTVSTPTTTPYKEKKMIKLTHEEEEALFQWAIEASAREDIRRRNRSV